MTDALRNIQSELNAPKNLWNKFGEYWYRSAESIMEALKPLLKKYEAEVVLTDDIVTVGDRVYVKATAIFSCAGDEVIVTAYAREPEKRKGQDESQITGTASSYARKYALNGLFLIDDSKDADTNELREDLENRNAEPKVSASHIEKISKYAEEVGVSIDLICETFRIGSLQDMTIPMWVQATKMLEKTQKQQEEKKGRTA